MNLKKSLALCLAAAAILTLLCACGSPASSKTETTTVKIGVTGSFYEDLWQPAKELLKKDGIDLQIVQFSDFVTPNNALANGEIDLKLPVNFWTDYLQFVHYSNVCVAHCVNVGSYVQTVLGRTKQRHGYCY